MTLNLSVDEVLTTTRSVRKRLDFDKPVPRDVLMECLELALQAPTGSNSQGWQWVFVEDAAKKKAIADVYLANARGYLSGPAPEYPDGDYRFGQQIVVSHDGGDYLNWESRSWRLTATGDYQEPGLREAGFWRFVADPYDPSESQAIELLLAHSAGYVELFYGRPRTQSSWELVTDALARSRSGVLVGGAKRLYGIVEGGDLAYVEERVDADGGLVPHLSARLSRFVG